LDFWFENKPSGIPFWFWFLFANVTWLDLFVLPGSSLLVSPRGAAVFVRLDVDVRLRVRRVRQRRPGRHANLCDAEPERRRGVAQDVQHLEAGDARQALGALAERDADVAPPAPGDRFGTVSTKVMGREIESHQGLGV
jgi:hypothetical protein